METKHNARENLDPDKLQKCDIERRYSQIFLSTGRMVTPGLMSTEGKVWSRRICGQAEGGQFLCTEVLLLRAERSQSMWTILGPSESVACARAALHSYKGKADP
jgi:hypothetical protein